MKPRNDSAAMHSKLIQYFNACYQADNREQSLWDIFAKECEFLKVTSPEGRYSLLSDRITVDAEYGHQLHRAVETYRREKILLYGYYLLSGVFPVSQAFGGKAKRVCSPLIFFDAVSEQIGSAEFCVRLDKASMRWNTTLLNQLIDDKDVISGLDEQLKEGELPDRQWLHEILKAHNSKSRRVNILEAPIAFEDIKEHKKKAKSDSVGLMDAGALLLMKRSSSSRGIIDELNLIAETDTISSPLAKTIRQDTKKRNKKRVCHLDNVPGILSDAQSRALENAAKKDLSLLVGPPGTGKSYTIACIVLESFMRGESVLVVSQNEYAVDVIQEKLVQKLGLSAAAILRAGKKDYHRYLKQYIDNITKGIGLDEPGPRWHKKLRKIKREIRRSEEKFHALSKQAVADGIFLEGITNGNKKPWFWERYKIWSQKKKIEKHGLLCALLDNVKENQLDREAMLSKHINRTYLAQLKSTLVYHRDELVQFNSALRARTSSTQEARFSKINYSILLGALPIWLSSLSSLYKTLPLQPDLFDLVIIDEATQCDIASCVPALYRAKRAVVVGDPKQLRHFSFLSRKKQQALQEKIGLSDSRVELSYRDKSMIDFADSAIGSQQDVVMLDEHYRSSPDIIDFSNRHFYQNSLRVMTEKPSLKSKIGLEVVAVDKGQRIKGVNKAELSAVFVKLNELLDKQKNIPDQYKLSIGVLSFFRDQAEALQKEIFNRFDLSAVMAHQLRAGTPYAFQGEERDIMLISCAVDDETSGSAYAYLNRGDVFNVAITRARDLQILFLSTAVDTMPPRNLLRLYVESIGGYKHTKSQYDESLDKNIEELSSVLNSKGIKVLRNYPIAGLAMDLVAMYESQTIAIDLVGFPGEHEDVLHLDRYKIFERAGLKIFPLSYSAWVFDRDAVLNSIENVFASLLAEKVDRLSFQQISTRWVKLLSINSDLASRVRSLEFNLVELSHERALYQLDSIIDSYNKLNWVLEQRLNEGELTYIRYRTMAEKVFDLVVGNLEKIFVLMKTSNISNDDQLHKNNLEEQYSDIEKQRESSVDQLINLNTEAILSAESMTLKWSLLDTESAVYGASAEAVLKELSELEKRIDSYAARA